MTYNQMLECLKHNSKKKRDYAMNQKYDKENENLEGNVVLLKNVIKYFTNDLLKINATVT